MYFQYASNLIISVDGFGVSAEANRNILELARAKKIDRVGVLISGKISRADVDSLLASGIKIDIQLHLLEEDFFVRRKKETPHRTMLRFFLYGVDYLSGRYSAGKVKLLWKKQIEDFRETFGRYPDGLNSHEYIHFFPPFFRVAISLREKFHISFLRFGKWKYNTGLRPNLVAFILNSLRKISAHLNRIFVTPPHIAKDVPYVLNTSDFLTSFDWIGSYEEFFDNLPSPGQTELIFHPERPNELAFLKDNF